MKKQLSVGRKISLGFSGVIAGLIVISAVSYYSFSRSSSMFTVYREMSRDAVLVFKLQGELLQARIRVKDYVISRHQEQERRFNEAIEVFFKSLDEAKREIQKPERARRIDEAIDSMRDYRSTFQDIVDLVEVRNKEVEKAESALEKMGKYFIELENEPEIRNTEEYFSLALAMAKDYIEARKYFILFLLENNPKYIEVTRTIIADLQRLIREGQSKLPEQYAIGIANTANMLVDFSTGTSAVEKAILARNKLIKERLDVTGPNVAASLEWVANDIKSVQDTIGPALSENFIESMSTLLFGAASIIVLGLLLSWFITKSTVDSITASVTSLADATRFIFESAKNLSVTASGLAASSADQASSLEETSVSLDELTAMVSSNTENANQSLEVANESSHQTDQGSQIMESMVAAIAKIEGSNKRIEDQTEASNKQISEIVSVINNIGEKTQVINDIVFQTKLLSFNASVEAARAGEHGKGFAVVAEEVGNLAQKSGHAANEISTLLSQSVQKVEGIIEQSKREITGLVSSGSECVADGAKMAASCDAKLKEISKCTGEVNRRLGDIASASSEQSSGISQINIAINQLDKITQENSSTADRTSQFSSNLNNQVAVLSRIVDDLQVLVGGSSPAVQMHHTGEQSPKNSIDLSARLHSRVHASPLDRTSPGKTSNSPTTNISHMQSAGSEIPEEDHPDFRASA